MNVLVVDDEPMVRNLLVRFVDALGYSSMPAQDGQEAWDMYSSAKENGTSIDIVLTDREMPRLDGFGLVSKIRECNKTIPILMLSGDPTHEGEEKAYGIGVTHYMYKPVKFDELSSKLAIFKPVNKLT